MLTYFSEDNAQKDQLDIPFLVGDVLGISFRNKGYSYFFEGICISSRKKSMILPESTLILRNILGNVGIEVCFSYFYNRVFLMRLNSFKKKKNYYIRAKLYYIRYKLNRASRVK